MKDATSRGAVVEVRGSSVTLRNLTLTGGTGAPDADGYPSGGCAQGAAADHLTLVDVVVAGCSARLGGGVAVGPGGATLVRSVVSTNEAGEGGGGAGGAR